MRSTRFGPVLRSFTWIAFAVLAWYLLLNFSKTPLIPQLDASWIAALTFAAAKKLHFGRDVIFTYGPLCHLAFSTYAPSLFTPDLLLDMANKAIYVTILLAFSNFMPAVRRSVFLIAAILVGIVSYQVVYSFTITCLALCFARRSLISLILVLPLLAFAAIASLVKLTFLWGTVLVLGCGILSALAQGRVTLAISAPVLYVLFFGAAWHLAGQTFDTLPDFLRNGLEVTTGYAATMNKLPSVTAFVAGITVLPAVVTQLFICSRHSRSRRETWPVLLSTLGILFLSWKLGFCRAGGHVAEFFYYAMLTSLGTGLLFRPALSRRVANIEAMIAGLVVVTCCAAIFLELPGISSTVSRLLRGRWSSNIRTLLSPAQACASYQSRDLHSKQVYDLPRIKQTVGRDPVDVFGYEQAIAVLNDLNYTPSPTVQIYCDFTPRLARINREFYHSSHAPAYVIFKLQTIDNRLPTIDYADVLISLARDYVPMFSENGYLLWGPATSTTHQEIAKRPIFNSEVSVGQTINVPPGTIWCDIDLPASLSGKILSFLYQAPPVGIELTMANGRTSRWRFLPILASSGFLINPVPSSEADFLDLIAGEATSATTVQSFKIVSDASTQLFYRRTMRCRFSTIPGIVNKNSSIATLAKNLRGYTDILAHPAIEITTHIPVERFFVEGCEFLLVHPTGQVRLDVPARAVHVSGKFAMKEESYTIGNTAGATFQVEFVPKLRNDRRIVLYRTTLDPLTVPADRHIRTFEADLPRGSEGELALRTLPAPSGRIDWAWTGWSNIEFTDATGLKLQ